MIPWRLLMAHHRKDEGSEGNQLEKQVEALKPDLVRLDLEPGDRVLAILTADRVTSRMLRDVQQAMEHLLRRSGVHYLVFGVATGMDLQLRIIRPSEDAATVIENMTKGGSSH
jgi:radical SAM superfamily enzyme YgiQ (UPF0313 family)